MRAILLWQPCNYQQRILTGFTWKRVLRGKAIRSCNLNQRFHNACYTTTLALNLAINIAQNRGKTG